MSSRCLGSLVAVTAAGFMLSMASVRVAGEDDQGAARPVGHPAADAGPRMADGHPDLRARWDQSARGTGAPLSTNIIEAHGAGFGDSCGDLSCLDMI